MWLLVRGGRLSARCLRGRAISAEDEMQAALKPLSQLFRPHDLLELAQRRLQQQPRLPGRALLLPRSGGLRSCFALGPRRRLPSAPLLLLRAAPRPLPVLRRRRLAQRPLLGAAALGPRPLGGLWRQRDLGARRRRPHRRRRAQSVLSGRCTPGPQEHGREASQLPRRQPLLRRQLPYRRVCSATGGGRWRRTSLCRRRFGRLEEELRRRRLSPLLPLRRRRPWRILHRRPLLPPSLS